jgi:hypothetical protein
MKNLSIIFALFLSCTIHAQTQPKGDSSVHLAFKGVPIDGTLNEYVLKRIFPVVAGSFQVITFKL